MRRVHESQRVRISKDAFWLLFAALVLFAFVFGLIDAFRGDEALGIGHLLGIALPAVAMYWLAAGAWRRTSWAQKKHAISSISAPPSRDT